jgi:peptide/nickel transport system permease protein
MIPGDPVEVMLGETAQAIDKTRLRADLGLDLPMHEQFRRYMGGMIQGDLGTSFFYNAPVLKIVGERLPATLELAFASMIVAVFLAIPIGIIAALRQYSLFDNVSMFIAFLGVSMPNFWLGPLLILLFSIHMEWFPVSGREGLGSLILPAITLGTAMAAMLSRITRSSVLEVLEEDFVTTARAKGLPERTVILRHVLKNALIPIITVVALQFGALLSGAIITETIFDWPGLGTLFIRAIESRDYPLVQGCVLIISFGYIIVNLLADVAYALVDPRVRYGR